MTPEDTLVNLILEWSHRNDPRSDPTWTKVREAILAYAKPILWKEFMEHESELRRGASEVPTNMQPQYVPLHKEAMYYAHQRRIFEDMGAPPADIYAMSKLVDIALAYARPIVCEECAKIVEQRAFNMRELATIFHIQAGAGFPAQKTAVSCDGAALQLDEAAAAIREHGKGK